MIFWHDSLFDLFLINVMGRILDENLCKTLKIIDWGIDLPDSHASFLDQETKLAPTYMLYQFDFVIRFQHGGQCKPRPGEPSINLERESGAYVGTTSL